MVTACFLRGNLGFGIILLYPFFLFICHTEQGNGAAAEYCHCKPQCKAVCAACLWNIHICYTFACRHNSVLAQMICFKYDISVLNRCGNRFFYLAARRIELKRQLQCNHQINNHIHLYNLNRNRVVAKQSRCEGVYNRTGDLSVTCFGKEERRRE